jgi:hypothetical protein
LAKCSYGCLPLELHYKIGGEKKTKKIKTKTKDIVCLSPISLKIYGIFKGKLLQAPGKFDNIFFAPKISTKSLFECCRILTYMLQ